MAFSSEDYPNRFDYSEAQPRIFKFWEDGGYFNADPNPDKKPHTIMIPLPNVTGALHLGHALNGTCQDVITRWRRMQGYEALWMPGTDHAGIATQSVVERRMLEEEGLTRHDIGREALVERIWKWKDAYEKRILGQLKELGASCDWRRTRFTLDDLCSKAVRRTFFKMFSDGLIFRGKRLVNWDTYLQTAVADDEVYTENVAGQFWTYNYPVIDDDGKPTGAKISFSTTRPETMLGDSAVCVHPRDDRYKDVVGKNVRIPLNGRLIPVIADGRLAKMEEGTGAVKVTPAHDPNDWACGQRNNLAVINILNNDGTINENAENEKYIGVDRYEVRRIVTADMDEQGHFEGVEDREVPIKHSDRSKTPIEPYLSDQWFVKMDELGEAAMEAVRDGRVTFYPKRYEKTYLDWLGEKRDWCISRQLWWGHRIPIWYCDTCSEDELEKAFGDQDDVCWRRNDEDTAWLICGIDDLEEEALGSKHKLIQDQDVLDTWFSSALWPHSTLGWPDDDHNPPLNDKPDDSGGDSNKVLDYFYPGNVLVTSRDIITLWVARMVLTGLYNLGDIPFGHVCVHAKILDGFGQTMSKTKGNGVDPMDLFDKYGTDAVRFTIASFAGENQDVRLPMAYECPHCGETIPQASNHGLMAPESIKKKIKNWADKPTMPCPSCKKESQFSTPWYDADEGKPVARMVSERFEYGRNFANKLWNAARFGLLNLTDMKPGPVADDQLEVEDRWILSRLATVAQQITEHLNVYHFDHAARTLYDFAWDEFCSFYIEMVKGRLLDDSQKETAGRVLAHTLDNLLRLLHPMMPFITEEVWQMFAKIAPKRGLPESAEATVSIMRAPWPEADLARQDEAIETRFAKFQGVLGAIREIKSRQNIAPREIVEFSVRCDQETAESLQPMQSYFESMPNGGKALAWGKDVEPPKTNATVSLHGMDVYVDLKNFIDVKAEKERNEKEAEQIRKNIASKEVKLSNSNFVDKAPEKVVQEVRDSLEECKAQLKSVEASLEALREME